MFAGSAPNDYERLIRASALPVRARLVLAGVARALRYSLEDDGGMRTVRAVAADILAPLLFLFVAWVLRQAQEHQLERLYFLSRDGYLMHRVATILRRAWGGGCDLHYLSCSRESLCHLLPGGLTPFDLEWLTRGHFGNISLEEISARARCPPQELTEILAAYGCPLPRELDSPLKKHALATIGSVLSRPEVANHLAHRGKEQRDLTRRYLLQEGVTLHSRIGLVDTGWRGTSQYAISRLLSSPMEGHPPLSTGLLGFYLGVTADAYLGPGNELHGFLFNEQRGGQAFRLRNFPCVEMLCSAPHGRVRGYVDRDGTVVPEVGAAPEPPYLAMLDIHQEVVEAYAKHASSLVGPADLPHPAAANLCCRLLETMIGRPARDIAEVYGDWPMGFELREVDQRIMAPPLTVTGLAYCIVDAGRYRGFWPQASFVRGRVPFLAHVYNLFQTSGGLSAYRRIVLNRNQRRPVSP